MEDEAPVRQGGKNAGARDSKEVVEKRLEKFRAACRVLEERLKIDH